MTEKGSTSSTSNWQRLQLADFGKPAANEPAKTRTASANKVAEENNSDYEQTQGYLRGYDDGLAEGRVAGFAAGEASGTSVGQQAANQLLALAANLDKTVTEAEQEIASEVLALALEISRQILRQTVAVNSDVVLPVIREALAQLPQQHAAIHLHPDDVASVRKYAAEQFQHAGHRIHEDPQLQRGDVVIEANGAQVDATLATRWRRIVESLGSKTPWIDDEKS